MWSVEIVKYVDHNECKCFDFDFETITEAYSYLWQHRSLWSDPNFELILYRDSEVYCVYDDFSE